MQLWRAALNRVLSCGNRSLRPALFRRSRVFFYFQHLRSLSKGVIYCHP
jgi:hypothetical protein